MATYTVYLPAGAPMGEYATPEAAEAAVAERASKCNATVFQVVRDSESVVRVYTVFEEGGAGPRFTIIKGGDDG